eukprot:6016029-Prymnesium_polylepis.2
MGDYKEWESSAVQHLNDIVLTAHGRGWHKEKSEKCYAPLATWWPAEQVKSARTVVRRLRVIRALYARPSCDVV